MCSSDLTWPSHSLHILHLATCLLIILHSLVALGHASSGQPFFLSVLTSSMCAEVHWPAILILSCSHQYLVNLFRYQYSILTPSVYAESIHLDPNSIPLLNHRPPPLPYPLMPSQNFKHGRLALDNGQKKTEHSLNRHQLDSHLHLPISTM